MANLKDLQEKLAKAQATMAKVFDQAGEDMDFSKVTEIAGTDAEKCAAVRKMNDECATTQKEIEPLLSVEKARKEYLERKGLVPIVHPAEGKGGSPVETKDEDDPAPVELKKALRMSGIFEKKNFNKEFTLPEGVNLKTMFATGAGWAVPTLRTGRVEDYPTRPIAVMSIIPRGQTSAAAVTYMVESTFTNNATEIKEGDSDAALYGEAALAMTETSSTVRKIAVYIPVTDEQLEDVPQVSGYLDRRLRFMLEQRLDSQIINGNGTAPNLSGIIDQGTVQTLNKGDNAGDLEVDALYRAITLVRAVAFTQPTNMILHPYDWEDIRLLKTNTGQYVWGHPSEPGPERIWGLPVVVTTAITEHKAIVGDFAQAIELTERRGITVKSSDSHDTYFVKGKQAIRADVRVALPIYRPTAFVYITLNV